ncbi:MAG: tRNA uridine-5-carboxymethylaminomethyl(34) synthesis GTPase MnmE [Opitutales bacterium]
MPDNETIAALSTPAGESAVALIRVSGPACAELAAAVLKRSSPPPPRRATFGAYRNIDGEPVDDCLFAFFADNKSFTGEPMLEIAPHGNPFVVQKIMEDLFARGCRPAEPGEFTKTAFLNGKMDLSQAEAVADLIRARSDRSMEAARRQLHGAVGHRMSELTDQLLGIMAHVEAYIDFPEEDLPAEDQDGPARDLAGLIRAVRELIETRHYNALLHEGVKTLIIGEPNVGKSSLINALTGAERSIVAELPGTTRDYVSAFIMVGGWRIEILDTAGLHEGGDLIERKGIEHTLEQAGTADFYLLVLDATQPSPNLPDELTRRIRFDNTIVVENKMDLAGARAHEDFLAGAPHAPLSLKTGEGLYALRRTWVEAIETGLPSPGPDGVAVNARHAAALEEAAGALEQAKGLMLEGEVPELVAAELRSAMDAISKVVGRVDNERMLDQLFQNFCIGK